MIQLSNKYILGTIDFIILDDESFAELKKDFSEISKTLESYKSNKEQNSNEIFNFFYNILKEDSKKINKYIKDTKKFKSKLEEIKDKKIEDFIDIINKNNIVYILDILLTNEKIYEELRLDHPKIKAELVTFKDNPNCGCRAKINKYFLELIVKNKNYLKKYILLYPNFLEEIKVKEILKREDYTGRLFIIDNNDESWKNFAKQTIGTVFKSFSIIERGDKIEVYFL
jgi:hypothetical protein